MTKRALLVGINRYPDSPLNGCLNDVKLMYKILKDIYGFTEFAVLDDERATKRNWIQTLTNMGKKSKPGDWLVQWYSGHGTQVKCNSYSVKFESDGFDECPVPYDHDWDNPFRDDDLNSIIMNINSQVNLFFGIDACFSGTMLKNSPISELKHPPKSRYLPPPLHFVLDGDVDLDQELRLDTSHTQTRSIMRREPYLKEATTQGNAILISGCSDRQTSADAYIGGRYHGAMTYTLAKTLEESSWNITYHQLVQQINTKLDQSGFEQDPQLECKKALMEGLFLGGRKN